jgi:hypothetical protein
MKTTDELGRAVYFSDAKFEEEENVIRIGWYRAYKNEEEYDSDICYVNGVRCKAEPAYMGGVVIQVLEDSNYI